MNYNLAPKRDVSTGDFIKRRCSEARMLNRKDVNVMCSWVVTLPQNVRREDEYKFFRAAYDFLSDKYGERNTVAAWVHKDETTPHLHFCWVPVVPDEKRGGERVSAHDCVTRKDLKTFHTELSKHIEQALGYEAEILNEATRNGNRSVEELKRETADAYFSTRQKRMGLPPDESYKNLPVKEASVEKKTASSGIRVTMSAGAFFDLKKNRGR